MHLTENDDVFVGSKLIPNPDYLWKFVVALRENCTKTIPFASKDPIAAHNAFTIYTLQLLTACTGHRAVSDPFWNLDAFDLLNGRVLIDDKSVLSAQGSRIAWLPTIAINQIKLYLKHLRNLSRIVRKRSPKLADQIWAVTAPDFPRPIPLFFFLENKGNEIHWLRIQPGSMESALGNLWQLPANTNRHVLSTWLHSWVFETEFIDAQLGHIEAGCSPFGSYSPHAPDQVGDFLRPFLDRFLIEQGWTEVPGIEAPRRLPAHTPAKSSKTLCSQPLLGPAARLAGREALWRKDAEAVLTLFQKTFRPYPPKSISAHEIEVLEGQLIEEAQRYGRVLIRLLLFRRHLITLRRNGVATPLPGRLAIIKPERNSFHERSFLAMQETDKLRNRFCHYLGSCSGNSFTAARRIAEILISAILFGGQTGSRFLQTLAQRIPTHSFLISKTLSVDASPTTSSPIRRWFPDKLSETLLIGYFANESHLDPSSEKEVSEAITELLKAIGAPLVKRCSPRQTSIEKSLAPISELAREGWRLGLPGILFNYCSGEHSCASPPLSNWVRLQYRKAGSVPSEQPPKSKTFPIDDITLLPRPTADSLIRMNHQCAWKKLTKCLGNRLTGDDEQSGEVRQAASGRSNARKRQIENRVNAFIDEVGDALSPIVGSLAAWSLHLCKHGTSHLPVLKASSVASYVRTIGPSLIEVAYDQDFFALPDQGIEGIYRLALESAPRANQNYFAGRLKEFHRFLQWGYGLPKVDWSEVLPDDLVEAEAVDAGIVVLAEYHSAISILLAGDEDNKRLGLAKATLLILIYRFGLRTGEAFRLTISDILRQGDEFVLYVRNSIHGETKSDNGIRQLPLLGTLSGLENQILDRWMAHAKEYADNDPLALLFPQIHEKRHAIDRSATSASLTTALRLACGDDNVRIRHLRHTCATRLFLATLCKHCPTASLGTLYRDLWGQTAPDEIRTTLVGESAISRRGMYAIALYMGHGSPEITLRHYIHLADIVLKEYLPNPLSGVTDKALAYCYQTSYENLRKIRSRLPITLETSTSDSVHDQLAHYFVSRSKIPQPDYKETIVTATATTDITENSVSRLSLIDTDRLLSIASMRGAIDGLAQRFLVSDQAIINCVQEALRLQDLLGYSDFGLLPSDPEDYWVQRTFPRRATLDKESLRVRKFISSVSDRTQVDALIALSKIWSECYFPHSTYMLIKRKSELSAVLAAWMNLGMNPADFQAVIPNITSAKDFSRMCGIEDYLRKLSLKVRRTNRLPHRKAPASSENRIGLVLSPSKSHSLGFQASLHRILFIVTVWRGMSADLGTRTACPPPGQHLERSAHSSTPTLQQDAIRG